MAARRSFSPVIKTQTHRPDKNTLRNSTKSNLRVQSSPPISLQRNAPSTAITKGGKSWQSSGTFRPATFDLYLSPKVKEQPKIPTVKLWRSAGRYIDQRPSSFSPVIKPQKSIPEPTWQPAGKPQYHPVSHFDPSIIRRSLDQLLKSTPDLRKMPCPVHARRSVTKSPYKKDF
jgi:hypothetical protein